MKALLGQLKGKTVEQQATAANAESWKRTKMIKDITTYARLNEFVAFAATINAETGDAEIQKAYQTLETAIDAAVADSSTLNDARRFHREPHVPSQHRIRSSVGGVRTVHARRQ